MADRSSAWIYGRVFEMIVRDVPPEKQKRVAKRMWKDSLEFDFGPSDMHADKALFKLGLAKVQPSKWYPEKGDVVVYFGDEEW